MLAIALENAENKVKQQSEQDLAASLAPNQLETEDLARSSKADGLAGDKMCEGEEGADTLRNEAGEAIYDSARNLMEQVTDSHASIRLLQSHSSKRSRGSKSRKSKSKKSHASVVLEEPSKEDRGFAFCSRYSVGVNS